jgi:hypothetical protein
VNPPVRVAVPADVVTLTSAAPAVPAGVTAVSEAALVTFADVAAVPPTVTVVALTTKSVAVAVMGCRRSRGLPPD